MNCNNNNSFRIGQIIYLLSEKAEQIIPAIVVEEVLIKKLDGNSVSWKVAVGPPGNRKESDSNRLKGEIYSSLEEIKEVMSSRLNLFIDNLVQEANKRTETWYGKHLAQQSISDNNEKIDPASLVEGINSTNSPNDIFLAKNSDEFKNIKISANPGPSGPLLGGQSKAKDILKQKYSPELVEMATPSDEDLNSSNENSTDYVVGENGKQIPIKYNINQ